MTKYYIYTKDTAPEALIAKYPNHAIYEEGDLFLFGESLGDITGTVVAPEDIDDYIGGDKDEDFMADAVEEDDTILDKDERVAARVQARIDARVAARVAFRVARRKAIRVADRRELRFNKKQGQKCYDDWVALQDEAE